MSNKFIKIPNKLITAGTGATTLKVYAALSNRCYGEKAETWVSNETISADSGVKSRTTLSKVKKELYDLNCLIIQHRKNTSNMYKVRKPERKYTTVSEDSLKLNHEAFKLQCYLNSLYIDAEAGRQIKVKKVMKEVGISRRVYLKKYLKELSEAGKITCTFLDSKNNYLHIFGRPAAQNWTGTCTFLDTNQPILINLSESNNILHDNMQENIGGNFIENTEQGKKENTKIISISSHKKENSVKNTEKNKVSKFNRKQIRAGGGKPISDPKRFAMLLAKLKRWGKSDNAKQKESHRLALKYVAHEFRLWDTSEYSLKAKQGLINYFKAEALYHVRLSETDLHRKRHPIFERFYNMTPKERQQELNRSKIYQKKRQDRDRRINGNDDDDISNFYEEWQES